MYLVIAALIVGGLFLTLPRTETGEQTVLDMTKPRGIRLNNPGNIRHGDNWRGMAPDQPDQSDHLDLPDWTYTLLSGGPFKRP